MAEAKSRPEVESFGFPNILRPRGDDWFGQWTHRLPTTHVRRYSRHDGTSGHVWQSRFKAFPIEDDDHLTTVLRDVERNPLRAELLERAEDWTWSSLADWCRRAPWLYRGTPTVLRHDWLKRVNAPLSDGDLRRLRDSVAHGRPYVSENRAAPFAERIGLGASLRPRGRPQKAQGAD